MEEGGRTDRRMLYTIDADVCLPCPGLHSPACRRGNSPPTPPPYPPSAPSVAALQRRRRRETPGRVRQITAPPPSSVCRDCEGNPAETKMDAGMYTNKPVGGEHVRAHTHVGSAWQTNQRPTVSGHRGQFSESTRAHTGTHTCCLLLQTVPVILQRAFLPKERMYMKARGDGGGSLQLSTSFI